MTIRSGRALLAVLTLAVVLLVAGACVQPPTGVDEPIGTTAPTAAPSPSSPAASTPTSPASNPASVGSVASAQTIADVTTPTTIVLPPTATTPPTATAAPTSTPMPTPTRDPLADASAVEDAVVSLYDRTAPGVVLITTELALQNTPQGDFPRQGAGTGFFLDSKGNILTNNHVIANAQRITVTLADGTSTAGAVVGRDTAVDLAVVRVSLPAAKVKPLPLGDSSKVRVGQFAIAVGNPFGLTRSITLGVVSATERTRSNGASRPIRHMIQTDAPVNPGNSGGPLLNLKGEVIGVTASIESPIRGSVGIGFAVPINSAKSSLDEMLAGGDVRHPWLGISGLALTPELARELGLTVNEGVYVVEIQPGSPADTGGLKSAAPTARRTTVPGKGGDVILAIDGRKVTSVDDVVDYLDTRKVGDRVSVSILRSGDTRTVEVKLAAWPDPTD